MIMKMPSYLYCRKQEISDIDGLLGVVHAQQVVWYTFHLTGIERVMSRAENSIASVSEWANNHLIPCDLSSGDIQPLVHLVNICINHFPVELLGQFDRHGGLT